MMIWLAVTHLPLDVERAPHLFARVFVPSHDEAARLATDHVDQVVAVDDG